MQVYCLQPVSAGKSAVYDWQRYTTRCLSLLWINRCVKLNIHKYLSRKFSNTSIINVWWKTRRDRLKCRMVRVGYTTTFIQCTNIFQNTGGSKWNLITTKCCFTVTHESLSPHCLQSWLINGALNSLLEANSTKSNLSCLSFRWAQGYTFWALNDANRVRSPASIHEMTVVVIKGGPVFFFRFLFAGHIWEWFESTYQSPLWLISDHLYWMGTKYNCSKAMNLF